MSDHGHTWVQGNWRVWYTLRTGDVRFQKNDNSITHTGKVEWTAESKWRASSGATIVSGYENDIEALTELLSKLELEG